MSEIDQLCPNEQGEMDAVPLHEIVAELENSDDQASFIPHILKLFEKYPHADFGSPGPFVHFIEKHYPSYLEILGQSVEQQPTHPTIWMINRILNSNIPAQSRNTLLAHLDSATQNPKTPKTVATEAKRFLEFQATKII